MLWKLSVSLPEVLPYAGRTIFSKYAWHQNKFIASKQQICTAPLPQIKQSCYSKYHYFLCVLKSNFSEISKKATKRYPMQSVKLHPSLTSLTWQSMMFSVFHIDSSTVSRLLRSCLRPKAQNKTTWTKN